MSTSRVHFGTAPENFPDGIIGGWTIAAEICFHGFADLTTTRGEYVTSPEFSCFGHQWSLDVYPGGQEDSREGWVAIQLSNKSNKSIKIKWGCSVRDADGKEVVHYKSYTEFGSVGIEFGAYGSDDDAWYKSNFTKRSTIMNASVEGSLVLRFE